MQLDAESDTLHADVADTSPTSAMHRRCGAILRPHTRTPSGRPLALSRACPSTYGMFNSRQQIAGGGRHLDCG
eukprot:2865294-Pyramimonas_sp.AAC.1